MQCAGDLVFVVCIQELLYYCYLCSYYRKISIIVIFNKKMGKVIHSYLVLELNASPEVYKANTTFDLKFYVKK